MNVVARSIRPQSGSFQVLAVFLADTLNTIFDIVYLYESVITHFGQFLDGEEKASDSSAWSYRGCRFP